MKKLTKARPLKLWARIVRGRILPGSMGRRSWARLFGALQGGRVARVEVREILGSR